jgi:serine/threonine protein kinase
MSQSEFGAYRLLRSLGHGGMADVWYAERASATGECVPVALKRIRPMLCDETAAVRMFLAEARLCMRFDHPNIVRTIEAGEVAGQPFMALEMIDGVELRHVLRDAPDILPIGFSIYVAREIALALAYAHQLTDEEGQPLGIVHRDVSPSNVMLGIDGTVKLLDFGVAKARRDQELEETRRGVVKGKIGYMAPEVLAGEPYDHRADLFSLGVILYELLTLTRLFGSGDGREVMALNRACAVSSPSLINPRVSSLLDYVTARALQREPEQRYAWAAELVTHLETALARHPWSKAETAELVRQHMAQTAQQTRVAPMRPPSTTVTARPRGSRRKVLAMGIAALVLAFVAPVLAVNLSHSPVLEIADPVAAPSADLTASTSTSTSTSTFRFTFTPASTRTSAATPTRPVKRFRKRAAAAIERSKLIDPFAE